MGLIFLRKSHTFIDGRNFTIAIEILCMAIPIDEIKINPASEIKLYVLRLDLIHRVVGGNKLFKLKYNLQKAREEKCDTLLTFGGAFSNHIAATALAGKENRFKTIGIIRGEKILPLNKTLQFAQDCGMQLEFVSREVYRELRNNPESLMSIINSKLQTVNRKLYFLPEGGSNELAEKGCAEIVNEITIPFDYVCCAVGTGTTVKGIASALNPHQKAIGIPAVNDLSLFNSLQTVNCQLQTDYTFGGYAKTTVELNDFVKKFNSENSFLIEPIYTGKLFYAVLDLIEKGFFEKGKTIVAVHTGGLQYL